MLEYTECVIKKNEKRCKTQATLTFLQSYEFSTLVGNILGPKGTFNGSPIVHHFEIYCAPLGAPNGNVLTVKLLQTNATYTANGISCACEKGASLNPFDYSCN